MQLIGKNKKVKRINIYLSPIDRKILNEIRDKYHLSYSTIANIIFDNVITANIQRARILEDHYYYEDKNSTKTSIKPRNASDESYWKNTEHKWAISMIYTNLIKMFTRKELGKYLQIDQKEEQKLTSRIYNDFQNTYDPNWDGNSFTRKMAKFIKQNPKYTRKLLEESEDI